MSAGSRSSTGKDTYSNDQGRIFHVILPSLSLITARCLPSRSRDVSITLEDPVLSRPKRQGHANGRGRLPYPPRHMVRRDSLVRSLLVRQLL